MKNNNFSLTLTVLRHRNSNKKPQTTGNFFVVQEDINKKKKILLDGVTLELPYKDNQKNISCIPVGEYTCEKYWSLHFKTTCISVLNVPNRTNIKIHPGNYYTDIRGCILVGESFLDINLDGYDDITNSKKTLKKLVKILPKKFILRVV